MKKSLGLSFIILLLTTACASTQPPAPNVSEDGLTLTKNDSIDQLYIREGTSFSHYKSLRFETIKLSYSDELRPKRRNLTDEDFQFNEKEMKRFQQRADKGFTAGIKKTNTQSGELIVRNTIEDFYLTSPIKTNLVSPTKSFVQDSSRFNITTELIDASTQQVVLSASHKIKTNSLSTNSSHLSLVTNATYWRDVNRAFRRWGGQIKRAIE